MPAEDVPERVLAFLDRRRPERPSLHEMM